MSFDVSYLGGSLTTLGINFSRSASHIIGQYYIFTRHGFPGIRQIHLNTNSIAKYISDAIESFGIFEIYNDGSRLPIICYKLQESANKKWSLYDLSDRLMMKGWQVPTYPLPSDLTQTIVQRIVCRADLTFNMADQLIETFKEAIEKLDQLQMTSHPNETTAYGFIH